MTTEKILNELNERQKEAVTHDKSHALVLAGAGCGKTKTIISRAAYLINKGVKPNRIQILTFTKRSASEIVERVQNLLGDASDGLRASTFHKWCMSLIKKGGSLFGIKCCSIIDGEDQLQLFRLLRGKKKKDVFPSAVQIRDAYSFARNTRSPLDEVLENQLPEFYDLKQEIIFVMKAYEGKKRLNGYLDYDDIIDIVAKGIKQYPEILKWVVNQYDHILVDEMQDTNPLQWELLEPLTESLDLFCVGDDAQSIYGFRGADFKNVHSFKERLPNSTILKLEDNYRSTQEILDVSNWLLSRSPIPYDKKLRSVRGSGIQPVIHNFTDKWEEGRWLVEDLINRKNQGAKWNNHMILVRSSYSARTIENSLLDRDIPYVFIGGSKLLESAHIRDILSVLRIIANFRDEIGWMRFLTIWPGIGDVSARNIIVEALQHPTLTEALDFLEVENKCPNEIISILKELLKVDDKVSKIISTAVKLMNDILFNRYRNKDWEKRQKDFVFIEKLAIKHNSIYEFIEEYLLDPVYNSEMERKLNDDVVSIITIHSAKGTEKEVCYVINVTPGSYPSSRSAGNLDDVEEERRVLYVALTRAKNELIITQRSHVTWSSDNSQNRFCETDNTGIETYFLNEMPSNLVLEKVSRNNSNRLMGLRSSSRYKINYGLYNC